MCSKSFFEAKRTPFPDGKLLFTPTKIDVTSTGLPHPANSKAPLTCCVFPKEFLFTLWSNSRSFPEQPPERSSMTP